MSDDWGNDPIQAAPANEDWGNDPIVKQPSRIAKLGTQAQSKTSPRWDLLGDTGRAAESAVAQTEQDFGTAFPSVQKSREMTQENRSKYGIVGGFAADIGDSGKRALATAKLPLDALGVAISPVPGLLHSTLGSALSYIIPTDPKIEGGDSKAIADDMIDKSMIALGPKGSAGGIEGIESANTLSTLTKGARTAAKLQNKAVSRVNARAAADNITAQDVLDAQAKGRETGDPITLMDIGKKNVRGLAGNIHRAPGQAGAELDTFLDERDKAAGQALTSNIHGIAKGSTFQAMKDLFSARTKAARPLFEQAFASDSMAPFETQFRKELIAATGTKGQVAKQISDIEKNNSGALAARGAAGAPIREKYMALHQRLEQAEKDRQSAMEVFQKAKADGTANAPGAVWSPRLQQFMDNPEIRSGLSKALKLEKQDSVTENRPFKDSDFGIIGTDPQGDPIVGTVPTMKSLAVAKEGLDARIAELKDPTTGRPTKAGLSLKRFRDEFVNELDRLNPKYKVARDAWSGPSQTIEAINEGKQHFVRPESNEEILAEYKALSPSDREFYKLGAAEAKVDAVERTPDAGDESKKVINTERDRKRFRMLFDSDAEAQKFIDSVERKRTMFDTKNAIKGGSQTAERQAEDNAALQTGVLHAGHAVAHATTGNWLGMLGSALRAKRDLGLVNNPELNSAMVRLLTNPDLRGGVSPGLNLLKSVPLPITQNYLARGMSGALRTNQVNTLQSLMSQQPPPNQ